MQLFGPSQNVGLDQPDDIAVALVQILDMVKAIDNKLDQVKEDSQALRNELARVSNDVEELKTEVQGLKLTLVDNIEKETDQGSSLESNVQNTMPAFKKVVEEYKLNTSWDVLKAGLEKLLDKNRVEYFQLQSITDYSWGHLWQVGSRGHQELATLLLDAGLPADKRDNEGDTMIHGAAEGGQVQLVEYLVEYGADINVRGWRGLTPINKAALGGKPDMVRWLANNGADTHSADDDGMTSLHFAAEHGHLEVVWLLVHSGLYTKTRDVNGRTPLDWAKNNGHSAVVDYLSGHPH